jgi:Putative, 10TM heavy-metal exporter
MAMDFMEILNLVVTNASAAFVDVTVFVGAALLIFGVINYKLEGRLVEYIAKRKAYQPVIGALLGLIPGCGGAILVMPLYVKKKVSFGTVVAALIATTGDSAFVLISEDIRVFVVLSVVSFVVAIVAGCLVDYFGIGKKYLGKGGVVDVKACGECNCRKSNLKVQHMGHEEGDEVDKILHCKAKHHQTEGTIGYQITHRGYLFYWSFLAVGLVFGIMNMMLVKLEGFWFDFVLYFGGIGTLVSVVLMIAGKKYFSDDTHEEVELKLGSFRETLVHNAEETAFVGVWVFVAFFVVGIGTSAFGADSLMMFSGLSAVFIASALGIIPGCGIQIIFVSLYVKGLFPFAALLAHGISQDGDALFPLFAMNKKASFVATIITTIVALVVGVVWYLLF